MPFWPLQVQAWVYTPLHSRECATYAHITHKYKDITEGNYGERGMGPEREEQERVMWCVVCVVSIVKAHNIHV